jgi:4-hydroxy-tetrahydrodipicolinate synthase
MAHTRSIVGADFDILSGDDELTATMMTRPDIRASGVISVLSNVVPGAVSRMVSAIAAGEPEGMELAEALDPLFGLVTVTVENPRMLRGQPCTVRDKFRNPLGVKTLMRGLGMISGPCRQPLGRMTPAGIAAVRSTARATWQANPELLSPIQDAFGVDIQQRLDDDALWNSLAYSSTT